MIVFCLPTLPLVSFSRLLLGPYGFGATHADPKGPKGKNYTSVLFLISPWGTICESVFKVTYSKFYATMNNYNALKHWQEP